MARRKPETRIQRQLRSDGALCVTFVNAGFGERPPLETYGDLLAWGLETGAVDAAAASLLEGAASERPGVAAGVARRVPTLRARLERLLRAAADGRKPAAADLQAFNLELGRALSHRRLATAGRGYRWTLDVAAEGGDADLDGLLWPVLLSAADLLTSRGLGWLRQCPGKGCELLFLARATGGRPRKWCGPRCRDRASSFDHYHRKIKPERDRETSQKKAEQKAHLEGYGKYWKPTEGESG
jgi:predicted RNA-binding Zn ribbon-like protein